MALQIGKVYSAKYLLMGGYLKLGSRIRIDARIIETETGKVIKGIKSTGTVEDFFALERDVKRQKTVETGKRGLPL